MLYRYEGRDLSRSSNQLDDLTAALATRYRIDREIGQGGMATVFLAWDLRHERNVAVKVLRPELAAIIGADRFLAEIRTTASLQHPHILSLHDSGEVDGTVFYVMPFVEGESLRDRLAREKQLPINDALRIAKEVASALDYAHRRGIVHRDIKPENILLHDGAALVADFGIALAVAKTGDTRMTETGMSLGTPTYMSPEQAMGERTLDARTDIYASGCVLYEMLVGEPPFTGPTAQSIVARVLTEEPRSLTVQRRSIPAHVDAAVRTALEKLPADRFPTAAAFAESLGRADSGQFRDQVSVPSDSRRAAPARFRTVMRAAPWVLLGVVSVLALWQSQRPLPPPAPVARFRLTLNPEPVTIVPGEGFAVSPDGSRIVYTAGEPSGAQLFVRRLDGDASVAIPGTQGAVSPFFSPDGQWLGYFLGGRVLKTPVAGGPALVIADVQGPNQNMFHASWGSQDMILLADERGLLLVPAGGGTPTLVASPDALSGESYQLPEFLPGGRAALFSIRRGNVDRLAAVTLDDRSVKRFDVPGSNPRYVEGGWVVMAVVDSTNSHVVMSGSLLAAPFDARRLAFRGAATPVAERIPVGQNSRAAKLGISARGAMVFAEGATASLNLVTLHRSGTARILSPEPHVYRSPVFSPDGRRIALESGDAQSDIWTFDLDRRTLTRLTFDRTATSPIWTPDGRRIVYSRTGQGRDIASIPSDGSGSAEPLLATAENEEPVAVTPDGRTLLYRQEVSGGGHVLRFVRLDQPGATPVDFLRSEFQKGNATLSPDGRWVAYQSPESGRSEVYVRPFPGPGGRYQVSLDGGTEPRWSAGSGEIFYRHVDSWMAAAVETEPGFVVRSRTQLFRASAATATPGAASSAAASYDVSHDGQQILTIQAAESQFQVVIVLNWFENLDGRGAAARIQR